ncbi:hypothetical protein EB796_012967 [Bugula neritina]|uniref:Uncharacterized protein n=1 Tax=Bugula neritina TaxID=10212 RepID=A0A7J7JTA3_BUGNE|nr:hypothetical protein EB796_012967 [Bugula neritina]
MCTCFCDEVTGLATGCSGAVIIHRTGVTTVPDISNTKLSLLMLGENEIQLFPHNYTKISWPNELTHVALQDNNIDYLPDKYFSGSNIQFL